MSLNVCFFAHYGAQLYREGTKFAKGHLNALMGHLSIHIRALIATTEPGNYPRDFFFFFFFWGGGGVGGDVLFSSPSLKKYVKHVKRNFVYNDASLTH